MIEFQKAYQPEKSLNYIKDCLMNNKLSGDGDYTELCQQWLRRRLKVDHILMTTSCTHALELALHRIGIGGNDEVIVPSFTYPSTANAVLMAGGKVVFSQVRQEDLTLDAKRLEEKITKNSKAIIVVHYGGHVCAMDEIMAIARAHNLYVIEDSAQSFLSTYKNQLAGTIGDFGCFSFHGTKDIVAGEGGALVIKNPNHALGCENFRDKGTNRKAYLRGEVEFYEWVGKGSSYGPSELLMALLYSQLEASDDIIRMRQAIRQVYVEHFSQRDYAQLVGTSGNDEDVINNGHMFYLIFKDAQLCKDFRIFMKMQGIMVYTHFVPLHSSQYGQQFYVTSDNFEVEETLGQRLVRLPLYPDLSHDQVMSILQAVDKFMSEVTNDISHHTDL